jgi:hypothetical protein
MLAVMVILGCGGLALGFVWKRKLPSVLILSFLIAVGFGIYLGTWSFLQSPSYVLRNAIYMTLTVSGYFAMIVMPTVAGTVAGYYLREALRKG